MNRKFLVRLAPVLVIAAFAVMPAAAQAVHWQKNGVNTANGEKFQTISWGTLTLESSAGNISCHNAAAANVENTATEAKQESIAFATWECKPLSGECAEEGLRERATAKNYPWTGNVTEPSAEVFKSKFANIEVNIECYKSATEELIPGSGGGKVTGSLLFKTGKVLTEEGASEPENKNGTSPGKPSEVIITGEPGHLYAESEIEIPLRVRFAPVSVGAGSKLIKAEPAGKKFPCASTSPPSTCTAKVGTLVEEFPPEGTGGGLDGLVIPPGTEVTKVEPGEEVLEVNNASPAGSTAICGAPPAGCPLHFKTPAASKVKTAIKGTTKGTLKTEIYSASTPIPLVTLGP